MLEKTVSKNPSEASTKVWRQRAHPPVSVAPRMDHHQIEVRHRGRDHHRVGALIDILKGFVHQVFDQFAVRRGVEHLPILGPPPILGRDATVRDSFGVCIS